MASKENRLQQIAEIVNKRGGDVSVRDIAEELDLSTGYICKLVPDAIEEHPIEGEKRVPNLGYIFNRDDPTRTDGGERKYDGELEVLPTKAALLWGVKTYAPERHGEAVGKPLRELRKFVKNEIADGTVPVNHAWRLDPA